MKSKSIQTMRTLVLLLIMIPALSYGQNNLVKSTIKKINIDKTDPVKSVYDWVANNIKYDVKKLKKITRTGNFKSTEKTVDRLEDVIKSKKGVCQHYSELFDALVKELGYESKVVTGYTKLAGEEVDNTLGHAWNAVKVDGEWKLYDTTWGSGAIRNRKKFIRKYNPIWYDVNPKQMIHTHIPFDPAWQLLDRPVSFANFNDNKLTSSYKGIYDFNEIITANSSIGQKEQLLGAVQRSKSMGVGNNLVKQWIQMMELNASVIAHNKKVGEKNEQINKFNEATKIMKSTTELFNKYIGAKNNGYKNWSSSKLKATMKSLNESCSAALKIYTSIEVKDSELRASLNKSIKQTMSLFDRIKKETRIVNSKQR